MFLEHDIMMMTALQEIKLTQRRQEQHIQEILRVEIAPHIADITSVLQFPLYSVQAMQVQEAKLQDITTQKSLVGVKNNFHSYIICMILYV